MNKISFIFILLFIQNIVFAQNEIFVDKIYQDSIKTVQLKPTNTQFSYPILKIDSNNKLLLSFDDLNSDNQVFDYYYTFIHCNSDWTKSELYFQDYCDGFEDNQIYDYDNSFNTLKDFTNFYVEFPNNDINFLKSGNYIVYVYKNGDLQDSVLTQRFVVSENSASITGNVRVPTISSYRETSQQVDFTVTSNEFSKTNPLQYASVYVRQNNRSDIQRKITPSFVNGNELKFDNSLNNIFFAGNEFRFFDAQSIRFKSEKISDIELKNFYYNFILLSEPERTRYFFHKDINGSYVIQNALGRDPNSDADYVYVHFSYQRDYPYTNNDVYVFGELSNWNYSPEFKMEYNKTTKAYEKTIFLKQGYYNYQFKLKNDNNLTQIDGNFYETENNYVIYVYLFDFIENYDRLIGVKVLGN